MLTEKSCKIQKCCDFWHVHKNFHWQINDNGPFNPFSAFFWWVTTKNNIFHSKRLSYMCEESILHFSIKKLKLMNFRMEKKWKCERHRPKHPPHFLRLLSKWKRPETFESNKVNELETSPEHYRNFFLCFFFQDIQTVRTYYLIFMLLLRDNLHLVISVFFSFFVILLNQTINIFNSFFLKPYIVDQHF